MLMRSKFQMLREIFQDPERKHLIKILWELMSLWVYYKEIPVHYFSRYLFKKGTTNIHDYVPNNLAAKLAPIFNGKKVKEVLDNKLYFDLFYSQFDISLPKVLMYNHKNIFIIQKSTHKIDNVHDFRLILDELLEQNTSVESLFIKKTYSSSSGKNIFKLSREVIHDETSPIPEIFNDIISSEFVFQGTVRQHQELIKLSPSSLNTIRFDTFTDSKGITEIISGFLKMSTNDAIVDNTVAGGYCVGIHLETGQLKQYGYSKLKISGVKMLKEHPLTNIQFEGFTIPFFHQAMELVLKAATLMPGLRLVGWDVGISEDGPVLIEGNSDYGINSNDLMYGGYMRNNTFRKILREIGYN